MTGAARGSLTRVAVVLAAGNLMTRLLGLLYRLALTRWLGGEGLGLFQMGVSLYLALAQPLAASLPSALAQVLARGRRGDAPGPAQRRLVWHIALASLGLVALASVALPRLPPEWFGQAWELARPVVPLGVVGAALACAVVGATVRGTLLAYDLAAPITAGQLADQLTRLLVLYLAAWAAGGPALGLEPRLQVAFANLLLGEAAGLLVLGWALRALYARPWPLRRSGSEDARFQSVVRMAWPLAVQRGFFSVEHLVEASLIPLLLMRAGFGQREALAAYGVLTGVAAPLLYLPMVGVGAVAGALVPGVAAALVRPELVRHRVRRGLRLAAETGALSAVVFWSAGPDLAAWLFGGAVSDGRLAAGVVRLLAPAALFLYVDTTAAAALRGAGRPTAPLAVDVAAALLRLAVTWALVPHAGLGGLAAGVHAAVAAACLLDVFLVFRLLGLGAGEARDLVLPAAAAALTMAALPVLGVPAAGATARTAAALVLYGTLRLAAGGLRR